jgi:hypothetical protein
MRSTLITSLQMSGKLYCEKKINGSQSLYQIAEGTLHLDSVWKDQSVNVLLPKSSSIHGANLVIARDVLPLGLSFADYVAQQKQSFKAQLVDCEFLADTAGQIDSCEAHFIELSWRSDGKPIFQVMAMVLHAANALLNFTGSIPGRRDEDTRVALLAAIQSFRFAQ